MVSAMDEQAYPRIPDYAFISDCQSLVLIGRDASVEWACFQRFDNRAVFARILDRDRGGYFRIVAANSGYIVAAPPRTAASGSLKSSANSFRNAFCPGR